MHDPTNGELAIMIGNLASDVGDIKIQTMKTNGRVTKLEAFKNVFYGIIVGVPTVSAIVLGIIQIRK